MPLKRWVFQKEECRRLSVDDDDFETVKDLFQKNITLSATDSNWKEEVDQSTKELASLSASMMQLANPSVTKNDNKTAEDVEKDIMSLAVKMKGLRDMLIYYRIFNTASLQMNS